MIRVTHLVPILQQHLVVLAECRAENDARDALEAMYPFLAFRPLPADVEHVYSALCEHPGAVDDQRESTHDKGPNENRVSMIPLLVARARNTSVSVGM